MTRGAPALLPARSALLGLTLLVLECGGREEPGEPAREGVADTTGASLPGIETYDALLDTLYAMGLTVEPAGKIRQPFFSVEGEVVGVNGYEVEVFEYPDSTAAEADASLVSADGGSVGPTLVHWVAPPHFYRRGRLMVVYIGEDPVVAEALESVLGPPFAGR